jgi:glutathione peroxidase
MNIYNFKVNDNQNNVVDLSIYSGKILLIINTATKCGFTPQYKYFQSLYERFKENSFEILDFPCDQFFHQAPGSDSEINSFCELKYHTTFKRFAKIDVNGKNESPLYTFLKSKKSGLFSSKIK